MNFLLDPAVAIYVALAVALVVWIAVFAFLWRVDQRVRELNRQLKDLPAAEPPAPRATLEARNGRAEASATTKDSTA